MIQPRYLYKCTNRQCRNYGREWEAMSPAASKQATGRGVHCGRCGQVAYLRVDLGSARTTETNDPFEAEP